MTGLFRSKSVGFPEFNPRIAPPNSFSRQSWDDDDDDVEEEEEGYNGALRNRISTPFIMAGGRGRGGDGNAIVDILVAALRKSLVTCSVETTDDVISSMDISWPSEVRHVSHVTFDRFNGFLGLPTEFEPDIPRKVPSASAKVFGVSANSMQCTYDDRGNSVPTILLMMQKRLYVEGGLKAEGIFRINAENSQEEYVRDQLNNGVVPRGIEVHCLSGLIKAWFRELPSGVLDSLTPEQVMHCNTEDDCTQLVKLLPPTEAALLDWAINLMADVVDHEQYNKMNARNIAMVFAPNMTQMADPLTALIHAVQVMNLLKTLILKNLREREESAAKKRHHSAHLDSQPDERGQCQSDLQDTTSGHSTAASAPEAPTSGEFMRSATMNRLESDKYSSMKRKNNTEDETESISGNSPPCSFETGDVNDGCKGGYENGDWLRLRKGVRRLCRHPVFQLGKSTKKNQNLGIVNNRGGEAWAYI
ncbi:Rho GTPase-activating protein 3 [Euphorbia peplus]|nr:Rho GTPase-activating protein 3 [Euphorbia peplus]